MLDSLDVGIWPFLGIRVSQKAAITCYKDIPPLAQVIVTTSDCVFFDTPTKHALIYRQLRFLDCYVWKYQQSSVEKLILHTLVNIHDAYTTWFIHDVTVYHSTVLYIIDHYVTLYVHYNYVHSYVRDPSDDWAADTTSSTPPLPSNLIRLTLRAQDSSRHHNQGAFVYADL